MHGAAFLIPGGIAGATVPGMAVENHHCPSGARLTAPRPGEPVRANHSGQDQVSVLVEKRAIGVGQGQATKGFWQDAYVHEGPMPAGEVVNCQSWENSLSYWLVSEVSRSTVLASGVDTMEVIKERRAWMKGMEND